MKKRKHRNLPISVLEKKIQLVITENILVNIYNYILEDSQANGTGWSKARTKDMLNYVYDGQPDHMGYELIDQWKKELRDLGYIKFVKEENEWRTYIAKELDF